MSTIRANIITDAAGTGTPVFTNGMTDAIGNVRDIVNSDKTAAYVLVLSDNGKMINITTGGVTVNSGIFSAGQNITIYNNSASSQTLRVLVLLCIWLDRLLLETAHLLPVEFVQ